MAKDEVNVGALAVGILKNQHDETVTREELSKELELKGAKKSDIVKLFKEVGPEVVVKKNPIMFDRDQLTKSIEVSLRTDSTLQTNEPEGAQVLSKRDSIIDATLDPSLLKFIPTTSYRLLMKRMNPRYPMNIFVFGETGVGKSSAALHISKAQGIPAIRVNLSRFAEVDDLFGGMRIVDGTTFFDKGPALIAMEMGARLILDEIDSADPQFLTDLHPILEGRGYLIKKLKQMIYPKAGFCVIATANTKGRGDLTGRYIGTSALNRALLDRFAVGVHYESPTRLEMKKIIEQTLPDSLPTIVDGVCTWYEQIDKAVRNKSIDEHLSPRKILDIVELMLADGVKKLESTEAKAIILEATNLMDNHVSAALADLWDAFIRGE